MILIAMRNFILRSSIFLRSLVYFYFQSRHSRGRRTYIQSQGYVEGGHSGVPISIIEENHIYRVRVMWRGVIVASLLVLQRKTLYIELGLCGGGSQWRPYQYYRGEPYIQSQGYVEGVIVASLLVLQRRTLYIELGLCGGGSQWRPYQYYRGEPYIQSQGYVEGGHSGVCQYYRGEPYIYRVRVVWRGVIVSSLLVLQRRTLYIELGLCGGGSQWRPYEHLIEENPIYRVRVMWMGVIVASLLVLQRRTLYIELGLCGGGSQGRPISIIEENPIYRVRLCGGESQWRPCQYYRGEPYIQTQGYVEGVIVASLLQYYFCLYTLRKPGTIWTDLYKRGKHR